MNRNVTKIILACACLQAITSPHSSAQSVPSLINYQGRLTDQTGAALSQGVYQIQFRLWDSPTATNTSDLVWGELQSVTLFSNGVFNVILGSGTPISAPTNDLSTVFTQGVRLLGLTVVASNGVSVSSPSEFTPRQQILSVPYALQAGVAERLITAPVPSGVIVMWSGNIASIPTGWLLCDGNNNTPDLRDRFVVGARQDDTDGQAKTTIKGSLMKVGGEHQHTLTIDEMPSHTHTVPTGTITKGYDGSNYPHVTDMNSTATSSAAGGSQPHNNTPPFYALAYIMKQ